MATRTLKSRFLIRLIPLASLKIAVICLALLLILTGWGTVYQATYGLYAAQNRFFYSWYFWILGFIPFPGAQLVLCVFFVNLAASMALRVSYQLRNIGNVLSHAGLLVLLGGSFVVHQYGVESYLPLQKNEIANVSLDRRHWELAAWVDVQDGIEKRISSTAISPDKRGKDLDFSEMGCSVVVEKYYRNSHAERGDPDPSRFSNAEGITTLTPLKTLQDPEDDFPGVILRLKIPGQDMREMVLFGGQDNPNTFWVQGKTVSIILRKERHPLPFSIRLLEMKKEDYPGTGVARNYQSNVEVTGDGMTRNVLIYMNHPLHYKDFVFYQASYSQDAEGNRSSVFAVVENKGRLLPYISSAMIFAGMLIHFLIMLFGHMNRANRKAD